MRALTFAMMCFCVTAVAIATPVSADEASQDQRTQFYAAKASGELSGANLDASAIELLKTELYDVQLAAERYSIDNSDNRGKECDTYPFSVNQLVVLKWSSYRINYLNYIMPGFYPNPFRATEVTERNAQCVPFGWNDTLSPGNFSYLTRYNQDTGKVDAYVILGYGLAHESGMDVDGDGAPDGVVIALYSSTLHDVPTGTSLTLFDNGREVTIKVTSQE